MRFVRHEDEISRGEWIRDESDKQGVENLGLVEHESDWLGQINRLG
jgi:hypothetical protein